MKSSKSKASSPRPYTLVARFYDQLLGDVAARMNRHARQRVLGKILRSARSVCDLGCGTGTTALELARRGLEVFAVDLSPTMCRLARRKVRQAKLPVKVICADMRALRLPRQVDLVVSEFNPLNHLPRKADLEWVARRVAKALRRGGYFCFDLNTPRAHREQYPSTHWFEGRGFCTVLRGGFDRRRKKALLEFEWFLPEGRLWRHYHEHMEEISWTDAEIRRALRRAGFGRIRAWDGADVRPKFVGSRLGYDAYYLAQRVG